MSTRTLLLMAPCLMTCLMMIGCGRTQVSAPNRRLLASLQTAVSAKKPEWLDATSRQLADKRSAGEVSEAEFKVMNAIVVKAQSGDWKGAQQDVFALSEGQQPTADDLAKVRDRKPGKD